jgi:serine/threonine protein kinase
MPLRPGEKLGPYEIIAAIGAGGMGEVYRALDAKLNRPVAIKLLSDQLADVAARRRFQREAQTASSLNHPHIVEGGEAHMEANGGTACRGCRRPCGGAQGRYPPS